MSRVSPESNPGRQRRAVWGLKDEEFIADFCLVSRRTLSEKEHKIFKYHYLLGADWKICCRRLKMERGEFFHEVYRIEQKLGRTFRELQPHALFPVDQYFSSTGREAVAQSCIPFQLETDEELPRAGRLLRFPVRRGGPRAA